MIYRSCFSTTTSLTLYFNFLTTRENSEINLSKANFSTKRNSTFQTTLNKKKTQLSKQKSTFQQDVYQIKQNPNAKKGQKQRKGKMERRRSKQKKTNGVRWRRASIRPRHQSTRGFEIRNAMLRWKHPELSWLEKEQIICLRHVSR